MPSFIDRTWRLIGTGVSFLTFGIGGIVLWLVGIPVLHLLFPRRQRRQKVARHLVHVLFWMYVRYMAVLGVLRFRLVDAGRLRRPGLLIVANHPTLIDVVFLISLVPDATCIVRTGLSSNVFTRAAVRSAGYVCNDRGVELVESCVEALRGGSSLIIFPEGTRTNPLRAQKWHRGAANVALRAGVPLTPVWISCEPHTLRKGEPWWHVPVRRTQYVIQVLDDVPVSGDSPSWKCDAQAARGLTDRLKDLLTDRVEQNAGA
jgi:1-acyl-sn-glycerol-3-phosphate acyltransferase